MRHPPSPPARSPVVLLISWIGRMETEVTVPVEAAAEDGGDATCVFLHRAAAAAAADSARAAATAVMAWVLQTEVTDGQSERGNERGTVRVRPERRSPSTTTTTTATKLADGSGTDRVQIVLRSGGGERW